MVDQAEIHRKAASGKVKERREVAWQLRNDFADLPDKEQAGEDLHQLTGDKDDDVRWVAVEALGSVFQHIPDKEQAGEDLHQRIGDNYSGVRRGATYSLGTVFPYVPDKEQAQKDLHQRTSKDEDDADVRWFAARALGSVFQYVPDKKQAWGDLIWLTKDEDKYVRLGAADALGSASQHALDKEEAWNDLHRLTGSDDVYVRVGAADALGSAFQHVPDKKKAWADMILLTEDEDSCVRASANHSLGRASIFKAVEGSDDFKSELKNAIQFFERSLKETDFNPSKFCLPFYRLFYTIAFEKTGAEDEVQRCLDEAEGVLEGSKNKETLLKAAKNLVNASIETQNAREATMRDFSHHLNDYRQYFDCAIKLTGAAERGAPGAAQVVQRTMSMVDERHKHIQRECDEAFKQIYGTSPPVPTQTVHISDPKQEIVRIAVAQFRFELTESFPFAVRNRDEVKTKVFSALESAKHDGANIVCLPELCLCEDWISEIEERCPDMIVIGGSFYKDNQNVCPVIMKSDVNIPYQPKIAPSRKEDCEMTGVGMVSGDTVYIYETRFGRFVILICRDFDHLLTRIVHQKNPDMIFCPASNSSARANKRFHNAAHLCVEQNPLYILIANTGKYGGTSIFGRLHEDYFVRLVGNGCKDAGDPTYKLCEVKEGKEAVILADFNLNRKSVQAPTSSDPNEDTRSVEHFKKIPIQQDAKLETE
jgi:predicted amidohydrolase